MKTSSQFDIGFSLKGKTAIITGGASGIGLVTAEMFFEKDAQVIIFDVNNKVEQIAKTISENCMGIQVDITDENSIDFALAQVVNSFGKIDILCNIAGIGFTDDAVDIQKDHWQKVINVNLTGLFFMCQHVGRIMIEQGNGGKIINMASQAGIVGLLQHACYGATKAAVINITKVLAHEWGEYKINVNAVSPTVIKTPMTEEYWSGERAEKLTGRMPLGRFGKPEEVAACFVFLASDASGMITGENLVIDGGYTIC
jgi:NAD(P)-dependent dehydrogenase (short-subunit alcohol dehydrogenase family)